MPNLEHLRLYDQTLTDRQLSVGTADLTPERQAAEMLRRMAERSLCVRSEASRALAQGYSSDIDS